ncbi:MAG: phosphoribosyltransferase [Steroidobacteraceae bacterium]
MIRQITFASCYVYSPAGPGDVSARSRQLRSLLKAGDARFMFKYAVRVRQQVADHAPLAGFLGVRQVLVPVPGSAPSPAGSVSVTEHLAMALIEAGLGRCMWRGLHRIHPVRKSATAGPGCRPTVSHHYDSFAIEPLRAPPIEVVLIDDVVTKGRTLLAAAARLKEACPSTEIRAFALMRTMGLIDGVSRLLDPCVGEIRWRAGDAHRNP